MADADLAFMLALVRDGQAGTARPCAMIVEDQPDEPGGQRRAPRFPNGRFSGAAGKSPTAMFLRPAAITGHRRSSTAPRPSAKTPAAAS
jgi:hypothetical protein